MASGPPPCSAPRAVHETKILTSHPGASVGTYGPLVVAITDGPSAFVPSTVRSSIDEIARLRQTTHAERLIYVYVAGERSGFPSDEARKTASQLASLVDYCVGVHEGSGFRASAVRGVVVGISMLSSSKVRPEIVSTIGEAAAVLVARFPDLGPEGDVRRAIEQIRLAAAE